MQMLQFILSFLCVYYVISNTLKPVASDVIL